MAGESESSTREVSDAAQVRDGESVTNRSVDLRPVRRSWLEAHSVEVVFTLLVAVAFAYTVRITSHFYYFADDWQVLQQAGSVSRFLDPYNGSLSLVSMVNDRVLAEVFGLRYTPERVVGLLVLYSIPVTFLFTTRRYLTAPVAPRSWRCRCCSTASTSRSFPANESQRRPLGDCGRRRRGEPGASR